MFWSIVMRPSKKNCIEQMQTRVLTEKSRHEAPAAALSQHQRRSCAATIHKSFVPALTLHSNAQCHIWLFLSLKQGRRMFECDRRLFRVSSVSCIQDIRMGFLKAFEYGSRRRKCGSVFDGRNVRND